MQWKDYDFLKSIGICPRCGKDSPIGNYVHCPECLEKLAKKNINRSEETRKKYRVNGAARMRERRKEWKEKGLCSVCGKKEAIKGVCCTECYAKRLKRGRKRGINRERRGPGHIGEVRAFLIKYYGQGTGQDIKEPLDTVVSKDRFGLITIAGIDYQIVDIGLRMLEPHELYAAQGFPSDYIIDKDPDGKKITKTEQVKRCGNAVPPPFAVALVKSNLPELCTGKRLPHCRSDMLNEDKDHQMRFS